MGGGRPRGSAGRGRSCARPAGARPPHAAARCGPLRTHRRRPGAAGRGGAAPPMTAVEALSELAALAAAAVAGLRWLRVAQREHYLAGSVTRFAWRWWVQWRPVKPAVVAVTGSYGKTSTKGYIAHLVGSSRALVASPRSFNNRAGLARAVNEQLAPGTEVFVAEMGAYGPGEIAELCYWVRPRIGVITAIGPVHLERFGSEERIVEAKAEIFTGVETAVLNVDDDRLEDVARQIAAGGMRVL